MRRSHRPLGGTARPERAQQVRTSASNATGRARTVLHSATRSAHRNGRRRSVVVVFLLAVAELIALREQIPATSEDMPEEDYDPQDRSLANTMRALRKCMRNLNKYCDPDDGLLHQLSQATVQRYNNRTDKRARYRPKNPDKKPLGDPTVRKMNVREREKLRKHNESTAA